MANEAYLEDAAARVKGVGITWTLAGLTSGSARVCTQIDWGAHPRPDEYAWSMEIVLAAAGTQGAVAELYVGGAPDGDNTQVDGGVGTSDAAMDVDARYNLKRIGSVVNQEGSGTPAYVASGRFRHTERYMSVACYNGMGATFSATEGDMVFTIRPIYYQGQ